MTDLWEKYKNEIDTNEFEINMGVVVACPFCKSKELAICNIGDVSDGRGNGLLAVECSSCEARGP